MSAARSLPSELPRHAGAIRSARPETRLRNETRRSAKDVAADHDALHFARALVDTRDPHVAQVPLHREVARVAVAAVDLESAITNPPARFAGVDLGHRRLAREAL